MYEEVEWHKKLIMYEEVEWHKKLMMYEEVEWHKKLIMYEEVEWHKKLHDNYSYSHLQTRLRLKVGAMATIFNFLPNLSKSRQAQIT
jgi:hypothetical protein